MALVNFQPGTVITKDWLNDVDIKLNFVNVKELEISAKGDGVTDDTDAIQEALNNYDYVFIPDGVYLIRQCLFVTRPQTKIVGQSSTESIIRLSSVLAGNRVQAAMLVTPAAIEAELTNFCIDHRGPDFNSLIFRPGFLPNFGDAAGCALINMADRSRLHNLNVINGWDNGIGIGRADLVTGTQLPGPDGVLVENCMTSFCGSGPHAWGPAPGGVYFQGAGIDALTATNFTVSNCVDYRSYNAFWADINGGAFGSFNNCTAIETQIGPIWSDAAPGGNQTWNVPGNIFGGNITGPGAGWKKTPGGLAFYSGSYAVQFNNCVADRPGLYGFVCDYFSSNNLINNCRVIGSGLAGMVDAGLDNAWSNCSID
ncbi:MAG: glycosyl hydrolase family 28-related protein, partial [Waterburya sp.]